MNEKTLFPLPEEGAPEQTKPQGGGIPRVQHPNRHQIEIWPTDLDSLIPEDHSARAVWAYVESLDLSVVYEKIRAVQGHAGRTPIDPPARPKPAAFHLRAKRAPARPRRSLLAKAGGVAKARRF